MALVCGKLRDRDPYFWISLYGHPLITIYTTLYACRRTVGCLQAIICPVMNLFNDQGWVVGNDGNAYLLLLMLNGARTPCCQRIVAHVRSESHPSSPSRIFNFILSHMAKFGRISASSECTHAVPEPKKESMISRLLVGPFLLKSPESVVANVSYIRIV